MPKQPNEPRGMNVEGYLLSDLVSLARGGPANVGKNKYRLKEFNDPAKCIGSGGSNNWARKSAAIRYILRWGSQFGIDPVADVKAIIEKSKNVWGGREIDSTHYEDFTGSADFAIQKFAKERTDGVYEGILDHNRYRAARYLAMWSTRANGGMAVGQRSAGGAFSTDGWMNWMVKIGMGWAQPKPQWDKIPPFRVKNAKGGGYPPYGILFRCKAEIRDAFEPFRTAVNWREAAFKWLKDHARRSIIPVYIREVAPTQLSVWQPRSIHSATEAVLVGVETNGVVEHGPRWRGAGPPPKSEADPGRRSRHGGGATAELNGLTLRYFSEPAPKTGKPVYEDRVFVLLDHPTRYVAIGGDKGYEDFLSTGGGGVLIPPTVTPPEVDDDPPSLWERFREWLRDRF